MLNKHAIKLQCALCSNTKDFSNLALILEQGSISLSYSCLDCSISAKELTRSYCRFLQEEAVNSSNSVFMRLVSNIRSYVPILDNNLKSNTGGDSLLNRAITRLLLGCFSIRLGLESSLKAGIDISNNIIGRFFEGVIELRSSHRRVCACAVVQHFRIEDR